MVFSKAYINQQLIFQTPTVPTVTKKPPINTMKSIRFRMVGSTPLMLNNPQTVNPMNSFAKAIKELTSKKKKTEDDLTEIFHLHFLASLYLNKKMQYIIPSNMIHRSIIEGAKENKLGAKFVRSTVVQEDAILRFDDNTCTPEELYQMGDKYVDIRAVGIMKSKVPTARAIIPDWSCETEIFFDESQLNDSEVWLAIRNAGLRYGIGTYRQMYGRYTAEEIKKAKK